MGEDSVEDRLIALETKFNDVDDTVDTLNTQVFRQQQQIDLLVREILELRKQLIQRPGAAPLSPEDERPPHY